MRSAISFLFVVAACSDAPENAFHDAATESAPPPKPDAAVVDHAAPDVAVEAAPPPPPPPKELDLHAATLFDNPSDLADWPITTAITEVDFTNDGVHVEFSKRDDGTWPDITPPGWDGPLEYTLGMAEKIDGVWYASAALEFWRNLAAEGGNVASDIVTLGQCTAFGHGSSCQVAKNWYYDGRWGNLAGYQPATGETIGIFVVAGNLRGVIDGSQSPVKERSNVVLVKMPDINGAKYTF